MGNLLGKSNWLLLWGRDCSLLNKKKFRLSSRSLITHIDKTSSMNRYQAFAVHLGISIAVLLGLLAIIFFVWYPYEFIKAGGLNGLKILASVDLVLGPILTLIVFDQAKKSLKFDLAVIGLLQISCMAAGLWLIFNERPLVQLLSHNGIEVINAADYKSSKVDFSELEIKGSKPLWLALDIRTEDEGQVFMDQFIGDIMSGKPYSHRFEKYQEMASFGEASYQQRIDFIMSNLSTFQEKEMKALADKDDCTWVPAMSTHLANAYACISFDEGAILINTQ